MQWRVKIYKIYDNVRFIQRFVTGVEFHQNGKNYRKTFENGAVLTADFANEKLIYPAGVIVHDTTTSNFSATENFMVFECVHRLLEKGYSPQSIELEPRWQVGRGAAGGKDSNGISGYHNEFFS